MKKVRYILALFLALVSLMPMMAEKPLLAPSRSDTTLLSEYKDTIAAERVPMDISTLDSIVHMPDTSVDLAVMHIFKRNVVKKNCFFVVSKKDYTLSVNEVVGKDTVCVAIFPVCYGRNPGNKTKTGDGCTPECSMAKPFYISEIKDAHAWRHDFKDGRGNILAYGKWFMRLDLSKSDCNPQVRSNRSIGIHGSTNNASSVPGRGSEGCIRLRDSDLIVLHDLYAMVGTKVVVLPAK